MKMDLAGLTEMLKKEETNEENTDETYFEFLKKALHSDDSPYPRIERIFNNGTVDTPCSINHATFRHG